MALENKEKELYEKVEKRLTYLCQQKIEKIEKKKNEGKYHEHYDKLDYELSNLALNYIRMSNDFSIWQFALINSEAKLKLAEHINSELKKEIATKNGIINELYTANESGDTLLEVVKTFLAKRKDG